jgi:hypothetical protein
MPEGVDGVESEREVSKGRISRRESVKGEREGVIVKTPCWKWHEMSAFAERSGVGEVRPCPFRATMKNNGLAPPRCGPARPRWRGRGDDETPPPIPNRRAGLRQNLGTEGVHPGAKDVKTTQEARVHRMSGTRP